ncbi:MAG TPA: hypothetical protein VIO14_00215 [Dehalococcoidia bacterium]
MRRLLPVMAAAAALAWLLSRRAARLRRAVEEAPRPGQPAPAAAEPTPVPPGPAAGGLQEGVWPGRAEDLIRERFPILTPQDLAAAGNNLERLAAIAAERTHRPVHEVYEELLGAAQELSPQPPEAP